MQLVDEGRVSQKAGGHPTITGGKHAWKIPGNCGHPPIDHRVEEGCQFLMFSFACTHGTVLINTPIRGMEAPSTSAPDSFLEIKWCRFPGGKYLSRKRFSLVAQRACAGRLSGNMAKWRGPEPSQPAWGSKSCLQLGDSGAACYGILLIYKQNSTMMHHVSLAVFLAQARPQLLKDHIITHMLCVSSVPAICPTGLHPLFFCSTR